MKNHRIISLPKARTIRSLGAYLDTCQLLHVGRDMCLGLTTGLYRQINNTSVCKKRALDSIKPDASIDWGHANQLIEDSGIGQFYPEFVAELRKTVSINRFAEYVMAMFMRLPTDALEHKHSLFVAWAFPYISISFHAAKLFCEDDPRMGLAKACLTQKNWEGFFELLGQLHPAATLKDQLFFASTALFMPHQSNPNLIAGYSLREFAGFWQKNKDNLTPLMQHVLPIVISYTDTTLATSHASLWFDALAFSAESDSLQSTLLFQWVLNTQKLSNKTRSTYAERLCHMLQIDAATSDPVTAVERYVVGAECKMAMVSNQKMIWLRGFYRMLALGGSHPMYPDADNCPALLITYEAFQDTLNTYCNTRVQKKSSEKEHVAVYLNQVIFPLLFVASSIGCCTQISEIVGLIPEYMDMTRDTKQHIAAIKTRYALYLKQDSNQKALQKQHRERVVAEILRRRREMVSLPQPMHSLKKPVRKERCSESKTFEESKITQTSLNVPEVHKRNVTQAKKKKQQHNQDHVPAVPLVSTPSEPEPQPITLTSLLAPLGATELKFLLKVVSIEKHQSMLRSDVEILARVVQAIGFKAEYHHGGSHLRLQITTYMPPDLALREIIDQTSWFRIGNESVCVSNTIGHTRELPYYQKLRFVQLLKLYQIDEQSIRDELDRRKTSCYANSIDK